MPWRLEYQAGRRETRGFVHRSLAPAFQLIRYGTSSLDMEVEAMARSDCSLIVHTVCFDFSHRLLACVPLYLTTSYHEKQIWSFDYGKCTIYYMAINKQLTWDGELRLVSIPAGDLVPVRVLHVDLHDIVGWDLVVSAIYLSDDPYKVEGSHLRHRTRDDNGVPLFDGPWGSNGQLWHGHDSSHCKEKNNNNYYQCSDCGWAPCVYKT